MATRQTRKGILAAGAAAVLSATGTTAATAAAGGFVEGPFDSDFAGDIFRFEVEGADSGWVTSIEGGATTADVVTEKLGAEYYTKKHLGNVKYNEFSVQLRAGSNRVLMDWVKASWSGNAARKSGELQAADFSRDIRQVREFRDALLTEVTIPALDATSKDPAYMTLKFAPELTRNKKGSGKVESPVDVKQKMTWKLGVDGLDGTAVAKIDAFTVKQGTASVAGDPAQVQFPDLSLWLDPARSASWYEWFDDFVIAGNNDDAKQKNGSLIMLDPTRQKSLLEVTFSGLGIFKLTPEKVESGSESIKRIKAELYVERIDLKLPTSES